jgi:glucokinase
MKSASSEESTSVAARFYLAADIGGTSSRFALFTDQAGALSLRQAVTLPTREAGSFQELMEMLPATPLGPDLAGCHAAAIAVAGAVQRETYANPPNIDWDINLDQARISFLPQHTRLINDFAAQAYACATAVADQAEVVNPGTSDPRGVTGVIGAGTGLGHGMLAPLPDRRFMALPSEAGHAAFAWINQREQDYGRFLLQRLNLDYVYGDVVVSGLGLSLLHEFHFGERLTPAQAGAALAEESPVLRWFARFYGRACRHFALNVVATGGMFIAGGVAAKNPNLVHQDEFMREFVDNQAYGSLLRAIPVRLNRNEQSGLWGAALAARMHRLTASEN